jgi:hypothetical protein
MSRMHDDHGTRAVRLGLMPVAEGDQGAVGAVGAVR